MPPLRVRYIVYLQLSAAALYFELTWKGKTLFTVPQIIVWDTLDHGNLITLIGTRVSSFPFIFPSQTEKAKPKPRQPEPWLFPCNHQGVGFLLCCHFLVKVYFSTRLPRPLPPQPTQQPHFGKISPLGLHWRPICITQP